MRELLSIQQDSEKEYLKSEFVSRRLTNIWGWIILLWKADLCIIVHLPDSLASTPKMPLRTHPQLPNYDKQKMFVDIVLCRGKGRSKSPSVQNPCFKSR